MKTFLREALFMENTETKPNFARLAEKYNCDYRTIKRYYENRDALPRVRKKREVPLLVDQFKKLSKKNMLTMVLLQLKFINLLRKKDIKEAIQLLKGFAEH